MGHMKQIVIKIFKDIRALYRWRYSFRNLNNNREMNLLDDILHNKNVD